MSQRKHPKQIGVNLELAKKERDRKSLKIGKDRRANLIRRHRKVMVNSTLHSHSIGYLSLQYVQVIYGLLAHEHSLTV